MPSVSKDSYWAITEIEVSADHASPCYWFAFFSGESKAKVAMDIYEHFTDRLMEVGNTSSDEKVIRECSKAGKDLWSFVSRVETGADEDLAGMQTFIDLGYPVMEFSVVVEGNWKTFSERFLNKLQWPVNRLDEYDYCDDEDLDELPRESRELLELHRRLESTSPGRCSRATFRDSWSCTASCTTTTSDSRKSVDRLTGRDLRE